MGPHSRGRRKITRIQSKPQWLQDASLLCVLSFLALLSTSAAAPAPCAPSRAVFASASGSTDPCCGERGDPCASFDLALARAAPQATITLLPGKVPVSAAKLASALDVGSLGLRITGGGGSTLDCLGGACLATSECTGSSATCTLLLTQVTVVNGVSPDAGGCLSTVDHSVTITNATFRGCSATTIGGGLAVFKGDLTMTAVTMTECSVPLSPSESTYQTGGGGALSVTNATAVITGLDAVDCSSAQGCGGSILVAYSNSFSLSGGSTISGSYAQYGGGIISSFSVIDIKDTTISECLAAFFGGGMYDSVSRVTMDGVTVTGCVVNDTAAFSLASPDETTASGGGLGLQSDSVTITNSLIQGCTSLDQGGGMELEATSAVLTNVTVDSNSASVLGAGVNAYTPQSLTIDNCTFSNNVNSDPYGASGGGGLSLIDAVDVSITGTKFVNNQAPLSQAGGLYMQIAYLEGSATNLTMEGCAFDSNQAVVGAGFMFSGGGAHITNTSFHGNQAQWQGGAGEVQVETSLVQCSLHNNTAQQGGALVYQAFGTLMLDRCNLTANTAGTANGGALWVFDQDGNVTVTNSIFSDNSALASLGGAIYSEGPVLSVQGTTFSANSAFLRGGGVAVAGARGNLDAGGCTFTGNRAEKGGGGLLLATNASALVVGSTLVENNSTIGGAILVQEYGRLKMQNSSCRENSGMAGGCFSLRDGAQATISSSKVTGNRASSEGAAAALTMDAVLQAQGVEFSGNSAPSGGGFWQEMSSRLLLQGCNMTKNTATFAGGVLYATHSAVTNLSSCLVDGNRAMRGGGLAIDARATLQAQGTTFSDNSNRALSMSGASYSTVSDCSFVANSAAEGFNGGAVYVSDSATLVASNNTFSGNNGTKGGGLYVEGASSEVTISGGSFVGNAAETGGGAVFAGAARFLASGIVFSDNIASAMGGGVVIRDWSEGTLTRSRFTSNEALLGGSGVFLQRAMPVSDDSPVKKGNKMVAAAGSMAAAGDAQNSITSNKAAGDAQDSMTSNKAAADGKNSNASNGDVVCSGLSFAGNLAQQQSNATFYDASYDPGMRVKCQDCKKFDKSEIFTTPPTSFNYSWPGQEVINPGATAGNFTVLSAVQSPVEGLQIVLLDVYGNPMPQDNSSIGRVIPDPRISGILVGTASMGVIEIPPIFPQVSAQEAVDFQIQVLVSSPTAAFPDVVGYVTMTFCPNGTAFDSSTYTCNECVVGSWCAAGQPQTPCSDGSFSFWPGAYDQDQDCVACDDEGLTCEQGTLEVAQQAWLDPASRNDTPTTYSCVLSNGCNGSTYTSPDMQQCLGGFDQASLMCAECSNNYYSILGNCNYCNPTFAQLFPLMLVGVVLVWICFLLLGDMYEAFGAFLDEIQYLCLIASVNLNPPDGWVYQLIQIYNLAVFDVDIVGPNCAIPNYGYTHYFWVVLIITGLGLLFYLSKYIWHQISRCLQARKLQKMAQGVEDGGQDEDIGLEELQLEVDHINTTNEVVYGIMAWLDMCYMGVAVRALPVFFPQQVGDTKVMYWAPNIVWMSGEHIALLVPAAIITVFFLLGMPAYYAYVVFSAKRRKELFTLDFQERWGFITERYKRKFYWWYFVTVLLRILYVVVISFLPDQTNIQVCLIIAMQVLRIAGEYRFAPLTLESIEYMQSLIQVGAILFTISLVSYNYLNLETFAIVIIYVSTILVIGPGVIAVLFDFLDENIGRFNEGVLDVAWGREQETNEDQYKNLDPSDVIELSHVAGWFREHALFAALLQDEALPLLMKVRDRFQAAFLDGLADAEWVNQLKKPQQYGGLAQVLLGNRIGHIVVAQVPLGGVFCSQHGDWHLDGNCPSGGGASGGASGGPSRLGSIGVHRNLSMHSLGSLREDEEGDEGDGDQAPATTGGGPPPPAGQGEGESPSTTGVQGTRSFNEVGDDDGASIVHSALRLRRRSLKREEKTKKNNETESSWPTHLEKNVAWKAYGDSPGGSSGSMGSDLLGSKSGVQAPSFGGTRGMAQSRRISMSRYRGSEDDYVEAKLDMSELTFAFQRNFGQLVKREKKSKVTDDALRYILRSNAVHVIFSWFTCPASTLEDQRLFARLVHAVRKACLEEAGGTGHFKGIACFYKNRPRLRKKMLGDVDKEQHKET